MATKKKTSGSTQVVKQGVATLFDKIELVHTRLLDFHSHIEIRNGEVPSEAKIQNFTEIGVNEEEDALHVNVSLTVDGRPEGGGERSSLLQIAAQYQCVFELRNTSLTELEPYAQAIASTGTLVAWPFLRELVHSITAKMGIPPFSLPMFVVKHSAVANEAIKPRKKQAKKKSPRKKPSYRVARNRRQKPTSPRSSSRVYAPRRRQSHWRAAQRFSEPLRRSCGRSPF